MLMNALMHYVNTRWSHPHHVTQNATYPVDGTSGKNPDEPGKPFAPGDL